MQNIVFAVPNSVIQFKLAVTVSAGQAVTGVAMKTHAGIIKIKRIRYL